MKIKHKAGSKTWREKFARDLIIAIREGADVTEDTILKMPYLPPGLLQSCALEIGFLDQFNSDSKFSKAKKRLEPFLRVKSDLNIGASCNDTDIIKSI
jgi:hypothetical protein